MMNRNAQSCHKQLRQRTLAHCSQYQFSNSRAITGGCCTVGPIGPPDPPPTDPPAGNNQTTNSGGN